MQYVVPAIFLLMGILMVLRPGAILENTESWRDDSGNGPSKIYRLLMRIGGAICALLGLAVIVFFILRDVGILQ